MKYRLLQCCNLRLFNLNFSCCCMIWDLQFSLKLGCVIKHVMSVRRVSWYADLEGWRILKYLSVVLEFIESNGIYTLCHNINASYSQTGHEISGGEVGNPSHHMQNMLALAQTWFTWISHTYIRPSLCGNVQCAMVQCYGFFFVE